MGQRHREIRNDFTGGYNSRDRADMLIDSESPDMMNIHVGERGSVEPRPGTTPFIDKPVMEAANPDELPPPVTSVYEFVDNGGNAHFLAVAGDSMKRASGDDWVLVKDGFTPNTLFEFASHPIEDKVLFVNGADGYFESDGITADEVAPYEPTVDEEDAIGASVTPDKPRFIEFFDYRVWLGNVEGFPDRVYYSLEDINGNTLYNYFTSWSWLRATNDKGEGITALKEYGDQLLIFTRTTIKSVQPTERFDPNGDYIPPAYRVVDVSYNVGAVSQRSITPVGGHLVFLGTDGVYIFDGRNAPRKISQRIDRTIQSLRRQHWGQVCAIAHNDKYYLSIPAKAGEW